MNGGTVLFEFPAGAIRFLKPVIYPCLAVGIKSLRLEGGTARRFGNKFQVAAFWAPYTMFDRVDWLKLTLGSSVGENGMLTFTVTRRHQDGNQSKRNRFVSIDSNESVVTYHPLGIWITLRLTSSFSYVGLVAVKQRILKWSSSHKEIPPFNGAMESAVVSHIESFLCSLGATGQ